MTAPRRLQILPDGGTIPRDPQPVAAMQGLGAYPLPYFPIGVWQQPEETHAGWAARGINTLVAIPGGATDATWTRAAAAAGLKQIRQPRTDISLRDDGANPLLVAWLHPDEPDLGGAVNIAPADLAAARAAWYAAAPHIPAMLNFSGGDVRAAMDTTARADVYRAWLNVCDWAGQDIYPVTGWGQPDWYDHRYNDPTVNQQINDILNELLESAGTPGKPLLNFIECCDQRLAWVPPGSNPTPAQQSGGVWDAIINGARGICYFTIAFNPFTYDNMTAAQVAQMQADNALIASLEPWLLGQRTPVDVPVPFQRATFTRTDGTVKTLTINQSNAAATLDGRSYQPYELVVT